MAQNYGVQEDGTFDRKHIDDIIADLETKIKEESGRDVDLGQSSPIKQALDTFAIEVAELWAAQEENYYATFYEDAFGDQLNKILRLAGISRIPRRVATGEVTFTTDNANDTDVTIQKGTEVTTEATENLPALPFKTTERKVLLAGDFTVTVPIRGIDPWETDVDEEYLGADTNVASGTINTISSPISGIDSVENRERTGNTELGFVHGRDRETDAEFKLRFENTLASSGDATLDAIRSEVFNAHEEIKAVSMEENTDNVDNTGSGGLPAKSFSATVLDNGELDGTIVQAILDSRPAGIESYGDITATAETTDGDTYQESFYRADQIDIYVDVVVEGDGTQPIDARSKIEDKVIQYIGGETNDELYFPGLTIGDNVIYDQVFAAVMRVDGIKQTSISIGTSDPPSEGTNLTIAEGDVAISSLSQIDVTVN